MKPPLPASSACRTSFALALEWTFSPLLTGEIEDPESPPGLALALVAGALNLPISPSGLAFLICSLNTSMGVIGLRIDSLDPQSLSKRRWICPVAITPYLPSDLDAYMDIIAAMFLKASHKGNRVSNDPTCAYVADEGGTHRWGAA